MIYIHSAGAAEATPTITELVLGLFGRPDQSQDSDLQVHQPEA